MKKIYYIFLFCLFILSMSCDFFLSYPEAVGASTEPFIEYEGILFNFKVNIYGNTCSPAQSFDVWTDNYGSPDFLDDHGNPKYWLAPNHPDSTGYYSFSEYSWNYCGKNNKPNVNDICPIMIFVRSDQTESKLFSIEASHILGFDSTTNEYILPDLVLECSQITTA